MTPPIRSFELSGKGDPVVLIHGSMNSKSQWRSLVADLIKRHTVVAVDLTGYGKSPFPKDPNTHRLEDEVAQIRGTLAHALGDASASAVDIVAHSYGGAVALCWACRHPEDIRSLTLFEPMANHLLQDNGKTDPAFAEGKALIDSIADHVAAGNPRIGAKIFVEYFSGRGTFDLLPASAQASLGLRVHKMLIDYRTTVETTLTSEDYAALSCPAYLMVGRDSGPVTLAVADRLRAALPRVTTATTNGGHMAPITHQTEVNSAVIAFLNSIVGSGAPSEMGWK